MTSPGRRFWLEDEDEDVVHQCINRPSVLLFEKLDQAEDSALSRHHAKIRQSGSGLFPMWRVFFSCPGGLPSMMRALMRVFAPANAMQRQDWGSLARPRPGPAMPLSNE